MAENHYTTISVEPDLRDRLKSRKRGGESYSSVLDRLLEESGGEPV